MLEYKTVSMCGSSDYCRGWNDAVKEMPKWISVKERLPDKKGTYLVFAPTYSGGSSSGLDCNDGVMFARWRKHWSIEVGYHKRPNCVTHWMPLPDAPEEDNKTIVFSKKKWMEFPLPEYVRERSLQSGWVDECDGKPVKNRHCRQFLIADTWCVDADEWEAYGDE